MAILFSYRKKDNDSFPSGQVEGCDVINSLLFGSIVKNRNNFRGHIIHRTPVVKSDQAGNDASRALGCGCIYEYSYSICAFW